MNLEIIGKKFDIKVYYGVLFRNGLKLTILMALRLISLNFGLKKFNNYHANEKLCTRIKKIVDQQ